MQPVFPNDELSRLLASDQRVGGQEPGSAREHGGPGAASEGALMSSMSESQGLGPDADGAVGEPDPNDVVDVLLVDDNPDYLLLIRRTLERHDPRYNVTGVTTPEEAYELLDRRRYDLVLLDYRFERGNGLEVIRTLKGKGEYVPTVMVTAVGDEGLAIQAMRTGALDFMPKTSGFVQALPEVAARAVERGRIIRERIRTQRALARRNDELRVLNEVASALNASRDPREILAVAGDRLAGLLGAEEARARLLDEEGRLLVGPSGEDRLELGGVEPGVIERALEKREVLVESDDDQRLILAVPLVSKHRPQGILSFRLAPGEDVPLPLRVLAANVGKQVGDALAHARLHHALVVTEDYLKDLVGNAGDEIVTVDPEGRIITWNAAARDLYGWSRGEVMHQGWELLWPEGSRHEARELLQRVLDGGETLRNIEVVRVTKEGARLDIILTLSPLRRPDGACRGVACVGKDLTNEKQLQAHLVQHEKMAAVGQLISGVAHELNNPLTAVLGYAELLTTADRGKNTDRYLQSISNEAQRCQRIVQGLLSFARKREPRAEPTCLNSVVRDTLELRRYDLKVSNIQVEEDLDARIPLTMADSHQLQQVLVNLINNAQQAILAASDGGRIRVETRREVTSSDGREAILVAVTDSGPGVPAGLREKIFDPFFTTKEVGEGTGLGLSLSYGIIQEHGGEFELEEVPEGGARFELRLPVLNAAAVKAARENRDGVEAPPLVDPRRILVVDEESELREMLNDVLVGDGHAIEQAADGLQALHRIEGGEPYDLIIVDLAGPDFDGDRLYREVRDLNPQLARRMLFAGGGRSTEVRELMEQAGNRVLAKPFGVDDLRRHVNSIFEEQP
jgi:two-component system NtrC family sensor kinase